MENWRRFQDEEDDRLIVENKRRTFESLMLEVEDGSLDPLLVAISLEEQIVSKLAKFDNKLNEGLWLDSIKATAQKLGEFVISGVKKVAGLLESAIGTKNYNKLIKKCISIIKTLKPYADKASKIMGPITKVALVAAVIIIFQNEALAASVAETSMNLDILQVALDLLMDLVSSGDGFEITTVTDQVSSDVSGAAGEASTLSRSISGVETVMADADSNAIQAFEGIKRLIDEAIASGDGKLSIEDAKKIIDTLGAESAMMVEDQIKAAEELCKTDPEACEIAKKQAESLREVVKSYTNSVVTQLTSADGTSTKVTQDFVATTKSLKR
jgi:polyhydroxyalkanoate synthesis regulator phasin